MLEKTSLSSAKMTLNLCNETKVGNAYKNPTPYKEVAG